nr:hypothetical protein Iba_scaffold9108CG0080 [Ipomoea batatas]
MSDCIVRAERLQAKESMATTSAKIHVRSEKGRSSNHGPILKPEYTEANTLLYTSLPTHFLTLLPSFSHATMVASLLSSIPSLVLNFPVSALSSTPWPQVCFVEELLYKNKVLSFNIAVLAVFFVQPFRHSDHQFVVDRNNEAEEIAGLFNQNIGVIPKIARPSDKDNCRATSFLDFAAQFHLFPCHPLGSF